VRQYFASLGDKEAEVFKEIIGPSWAQRPYTLEKQKPLAVSFSKRSGTRRNQGAIY